MSEAYIKRLLAGLGEVTVQTPGPGSEAPEIAWGDSFFYRGEERKFPFATIVIKDYPGFDEFSDLGREGAYRLNLDVGKEHVPDVEDPDFTAADVVLPHPVYARQGWVSVVEPRPETVAELARAAYERAARRRPTAGEW